MIDFDNNFRIYLAEWMSKYAENFESPEEMESKALDVYDAWLNEPADFLDGVCPKEYFAQFKEPEKLVDMLVEYLNSKVGIPDLLLDEISKHGDDAKDALSKLFKMEYKVEDNAKTEARMLALNMLSETDDRFLHDEYVKMLLDKKTDDEIANLIIEKLKYSEKTVADKIMAGLENIEDEEVETRCMDMLVNFPGDEKIYNKLANMFNQYTNTSLLAAYLGKYGDDRAIPLLEEALDWQGINYLDYIEIRNSIEELGKDVDHVRTFDGDTYYESLKNIE